MGSYQEATAQLDPESPVLLLLERRGSGIYVPSSPARLAKKGRRDDRGGSSYSTMAPLRRFRISHSPSKKVKFWVPGPQWGGQNYHHAHSERIYARQPAVVLLLPGMTSFHRRLKSVVGWAICQRMSPIPGNDRTELSAICGRSQRYPPKECIEKIGEVMEACGVLDMERRLISGLSKGYRQRVGLAQALLNAPGAYSR